MIFFISVLVDCNGKCLYCQTIALQTLQQFILINYTHFGGIGSICQFVPRPPHWPVFAFVQLFVVFTWELLYLLLRYTIHTKKKSKLIYPIKPIKTGFYVRWIGFLPTKALKPTSNRGFWTFLNIAESLANNP